MSSLLAVLSCPSHDVLVKTCTGDKADDIAMHRIIRVESQRGRSRLAERRVDPGQDRLLARDLAEIRSVSLGSPFTSRR